MFKIGDIARMAGVSVRTLHHYDHLGLLTPALTGENGYRLYAPGQLPQLRRIRALKALGFSLDEVREVLGGASFEAALQRKEAALRRERKALDARLDGLRLALEQERRMNGYRVTLKTLPETPVIAASRTAPDYRHVTAPMEEAFCDVLPLLSARALPVAGPDTVVWQGGGYQSEAQIELVCAVPLAFLPEEEVAPARLETWPPVLVASTIHHGSYERFGEPYAALLAWMEREGYLPDGPVREVYHR